MLFAIDIAPLGELSDPRVIMRLAEAAERSGWDGLSIWDSLGLSMGTAAADPFVTLAGVAARTERLRLITSIVATARRRPQLVVQAAACLDLVSDGRLILGVGAGEDRPDFEAFGETYDRSVRIARMDESLEVIDAGLRGRELDHTGDHLVAVGAVLGPRPVQRPRPPMWLGALKPGGVRKAARWDGWIAVAMSEDGGSMSMLPHDLARHVSVALHERETRGTLGEPFEVAVLGIAGLDGTSVADFRAAGATWWLESLSPMRGAVDELEAIVRRGPPPG
jgi:alkanesulfonate monooxygenase SsuD/methylene tetrahydromethanopterin reductase-like flavin-dependent oxidoreductase (luciferase family)